MTLHVFPNGKFFDHFYSRYTRCYGKSDIFYVFGGNYETNIFSECNIVFPKGNIFVKMGKIVRLFKTSDMIVFHSLFLSYYLYLMAFVCARKYGFKMAWLVWGGDLYDLHNQEEGSASIVIKIRTVFRKRIIRYLAYVMGAFCDYKLIKRWYKTNAQYEYAYYIYELPEYRKCEKNLIMIGHSAHPSSRHVETYEMIAQCKILPETYIYSNLSYGYNTQLYKDTSKSYIKNVIKKGQEMFGEKYLSDLEFCEYLEYIKKIQRVKVACFNNDRGQGFSNIANLLYFGAKVYINPLNGVYDFFKKAGVHIYTIDEIERERFDEELRQDLQESNRQVLMLMFSDFSFKRIWDNTKEKGRALNGCI